MRRYIFGGGTAVVTGAASGIGEALAHGLAQRGSHLVLLDRDAKRLSDVAAVIQGASVHPGGIRTRIAESARVGSGVSRQEAEDGRAQFATLLTIDPADAAEIIIDGIERRRGRVLIGWSAKIPDLLARLLPAAYGRILTVVRRVRIGMSSRGAHRPQLVAQAGQRA